MHSWLLVLTWPPVGRTPRPTRLLFPARGVNEAAAGALGLRLETRRGGETGELPDGDLGPVDGKMADRLHIADVLGHHRPCRNNKEGTGQGEEPHLVCHGHNRLEVQTTRPIMCTSSASRS